MKYIGQTTATLKKRNKEHKNWCHKRHKKKLLNSSKKNDRKAYHHNLTGHEIDFKNTTIIAKEQAYWPRLTNEGIEIKKLKPTVQAGYEICLIWDMHLGFGTT